MVYRRAYTCSFASICLLMWVLKKPQIWFSFHPVQIYKMIEIFHGYVIQITNPANAEGEDVTGKVKAESI